jgi:hypothetical protein
MNADKGTIQTEEHGRKNAQKTQKEDRDQSLFELNSAASFVPSVLFCGHQLFFFILIVISSALIVRRKSAPIR